MLESITDLDLDDGVETIPFSIGDPSASVAIGESKRYFVVVTMTSNAAMQAPDAFELFHLTEAGSTARDATSTNVPLRLERFPDTSTGLVDTDLLSATCTAPYELDLRSFTVSGPTPIVCEAGTEILAGNGLSVDGDGDLTLRAGQRLRLVADFSVAPGGKLVLDVEPTLVP
jgi:hypothetical protein